ncbi:unknown [Sutterella sp. CAG:397]|nr:unknown [Sutterella sp. CAG:397]
MILIVTVADKFPMVTHQKKPLKIRALPHDLADFSDNVIRITHGIIVGAVPS